MIARARPRRPPGPSVGPLRVIGALRRDPLRFLVDAAAEHGDIVYVRVGPQPVFQLNHPDLIETVLVKRARLFRKGLTLQRAKVLLGEGLLTSEGAFHLRQRRLAQPAFHARRVAGYAETMVRHAERLGGRWQDGQTVDAADEMARLTLAIVAMTLFGHDVEDPEAGAIGAALTDAMSLFDLAMVPYAELIVRLPTPGMRRFRRARDRLDATMYALIEERRASSDRRDDLLDLLVAARDGEGGAGMSDRQLRDEALTIFLAGHETTANALAWTWLLLAQNPEVEARLHAELDDVLGARAPTAADIAALPYAERVLLESMRLYPPAWVVGRLALEPLELGGYHVERGALMSMPQFVVHRDPRWFPDPERFDPDRWLPEHARDRPAFAYFPFGAGTRVCVGRGFAMTEGVLLLASLARRWRLRLVPGHPVELQARITLRPRHGLRMTLERRA